MSEQSDKPVLIIMEGEQAGQRWTIEGDKFVVGRGGECELVLPERQVSREHIHIYYDGSEYFLKDLGSKNGTWVNGVEIPNQTITLHDGDEISIAKVVKMTFVGSE